MYLGMHLIFSPMELAWNSGWNDGIGVLLGGSGGVVAMSCVSLSHLVGRPRDSWRGRRRPYQTNGSEGEEKRDGEQLLRLRDDK